MSKSVIKIVIGRKKKIRKVELDMTLDKLRESLKEDMPENSLFIKDDGTIDKSEESEFTINDILKDKEIHCSSFSRDVNVYINDKNICKININVDENIESLMKEMKGKIPNDSMIKFEDTEIGIDEAKEQNFFIKDLLNEDSIYFINQQIETKNNSKKKEKENEKNGTNKNDSSNENKKFIHIYKNGDIIKMAKLDLNSSISSLRELLKDEISDKAKFLSEGIGVPIKDEKSLSLSLITKEEKIYIEDNDKNDSDGRSDSGSSKKGQEKIQIQNKITITLKYDNDENSITKASLSDKLDKIRDDNQIPETYIFTFNGTEIKKNQENEFSIEDILDSNSKSVLLKNLKPKKKFKIFDEDNKSIKCEKQYESSEKLSKLRKELNLNDNKIFTKNSHEINIDDEDNFTVEDVEIDGVINVVNKTSKFSIFVNNNLVKSESFSPTITIATLRTYLTLDIPKECNFLHATKQTPIPVEMEDNIIISKICNEKNYIYIESEQKKVVSSNKPLDNAKKLRKEGNLDIYLFPSRKFNIGMPDSLKNGKNLEREKKECLDITKETGRKIIMVIGQTGSGKTTLLNSLINALCGIQLQDDFRYIIIDELAADSGIEDPNNQSKSRTSFVTAYNIGSINDNPPITIVDTPGFGDSRGLKFDEKIVQMIRDLFKNWIDTIDAICFVASASSPRLTVTQKYIFSSIVSLFGNDIADNFVPMLTFCDGKEPQILASFLDDESTFKKTIYPHIKDKSPWYLQFNNSAIFESNREGKFTELFWELGMDSFKLFFTKLSSLKSKSLNHSKNVLELREKMQNKILALRPKLDQGLILMEAMKQEINELKINADLINKTKNFKIKTKRPNVTRENLPPGRHTTTCLICNFTCHNNCSYSNNQAKKHCCSMNSSGNCVVCPKRCRWQEHVNVPYIIKHTEIEVEETVEELKKKYYDSKNKLSLSEQIIKGKEHELEIIIVDCYYIQDEIRDCIEKLKVEALYPNTNETSEEYIDMLIEAEKSEKKNGYKDRIKSLELLKQNNKLINEMFRTGTTCRTLEQFRREIMEGRISIIQGKNCTIKLTDEDKKNCSIF